GNTDGISVHHLTTSVLRQSAVRTTERGEIERGAAGVAAESGSFRATTVLAFDPKWKTWLLEWNVKFASS
ncbi:MAG: hypothetical protein M1417_01605, partial [Candidatus Thermoplasmatota archaeon]|nr:hypothetical protein [Candidatus Thermoplasmatota archaeon]